MPYLKPPANLPTDPSSKWPASGAVTLLVTALCGVLGMSLLGGIVTRPTLYVRDARDFTALMLGSLCLLIGVYQAAVWLYRLCAGWAARRAPSAWLRDYPWNPRETTDCVGLAAIKNGAAMVVTGAWLAPFHWLVYRTPEARPFLFFLGIGDVIWFVFLFFVGRQAARFLRFGSSRLMFGEVPFLLGGRLDASFIGHAALAEAEAKAELRLIREQWETRSYGGRGNQIMLYAYQDYSDIQPIHISPSGRASIAFDVPSEGPGTNLGGDPSAVRYWEVVVSVERPGLDYEGKFLVPIYGAPTI